MQEHLYSIVVPVYNSEKTLNTLYDRILNTFTNDIKENFELILIDDSSKDNSFSIMKELNKKDERVKIFQLSRNFGQHCAILCGISKSAGDFVITLDDDLQHPPEEIKKLIDEINIREDLDVVIGQYESKKHSMLRNFGTFLSKKITSWSYNREISVDLTSFRIMRKFIAEEISNITVSSPKIGFLLLDVSNRIGNVKVQHNERKMGKSGYTFNMLVKELFTNIYTNSMLPLIIVRNLGIFFFCISILGSLFYLYKYFNHSISVSGWITLILILLSFLGIELFSIGIIGEYLLRVYTETKKKPNFIIRKQSDNYADKISD